MAMRPGSGDLTHWRGPNQSGKWLTAVQYVRCAKTRSLPDYDQMEALALEQSPRWFIAGGIGHSAIFWILRGMRGDLRQGWRPTSWWDMAHFGVWCWLWPLPLALPHIAHVATTTTHRPLAGRAAAMNSSPMTRLLPKKFNSAIFPGISGRPLMHVIGRPRPWAFGEASAPRIQSLSAQVIRTRSVADQLMKAGSGHRHGRHRYAFLMLVDLRPKGVKGNATERRLAGLISTCNRRHPFDTGKEKKRTITFGIRAWHPAGTTRGFGGQ